MSSGFGQQGGRGRCFPFFQDFIKCYAQADHPNECRLRFEDYDECLWHHKETARLQLVEQEWYKQHTEQAPSNKMPKIRQGQFARWHGYGE